MQKDLSTNRLVADFLTHSHRISGSINVRQKKLADQLNDQSTSLLHLEEIYISSIGRPGDIMTSHSSSTLRKQNIVAVVVSHQDDGLQREHTYGSYFGAHLHKVFLTVAQFEVEGYLRLSGRFDLRTVLTSDARGFIPIIDGSIKASVYPDTIFTGGAILINQAYIGALCEEKEEG